MTLVVLCPYGISRLSRSAWPALAPRAPYLVGALSGRNCAGNRVYSQCARQSRSSDLEFESDPESAAPVGYQAKAAEYSGESQRTQGKEGAG